MGSRHWQRLVTSPALPRERRRGRQETWADSLLLSLAESKKLSTAKQRWEVTCFKTLLRCSRVLSGAWTKEKRLFSSPHSPPSSSCYALQMSLTPWQRRSVPHLYRSRRAPSDGSPCITPAVTLELACHFNSSFSERSLSPAVLREMWGEKGRQSQMEPGKGRQRKRDCGREGGERQGEGGRAIQALFIEGFFFLYWKVPPAMSQWQLLAREGWRCPPLVPKRGTAGRQAGRASQGCVLRSLQTP